MTRYRINPGELRHRITIQKPLETKNSYGEPTISWPDVVTVWASVNPLVGKEYFAAETVQSELSHKIRIRYRNDIKNNMRISFKGRFFEINSIINYQEKNIELQLMCKELIS